MTLERTITFERGLTAALHAHDLVVADAAVPAWTLVTDGLAAAGQAELVLTILRRREASEEIPSGVLGYVPAVKQLAEQGKIVHLGAVSGYRAPGPFGLGDFVGLVFLEPTSLPDVRLPSVALCGIFLAEGELEMATSCAARRVVHRLGKQARYFPAPYWSDPARPPVYRPGDASRSLIASLPQMNAPSAIATVRGDEFFVSLPAPAAEATARQIEQHEVAVLLPGRDASTTAALVWEPGQAEAEAIHAEGTEVQAIAATFVALVPSGEPADTIRLKEDGFFVMLSRRSASELVVALRARVPIRLSDGGRVLSVVPSLAR